MAQEKLSRARYAEDRQTEATRTTADLGAILADFGHVLARANSAFDFSRLKSESAQLTFAPQTATQAEGPPVLTSFLPPAPTGVGALLPGAKRKYQVKVEEATAAFEEAERERAARETDRIAALSQERHAFEATVAGLEASVSRQHDDVDELEARFAAGDPDAVTEYYAAVLSLIALPYDPPDGASRVAFSPQSRQLAIELELPTFDVIPTDREYRYIKTRDEIKPMPLPATERKRLYASLIAQVALAVLRAAFRADTHAVADTIVLNGHVHTIDKRTGRKPLELIDGGNLLFLLQEHAGIEAKIEAPEDWIDPEPPS